MKKNPAGNHGHALRRARIGWSRVGAGLFALCLAFEAAAAAEITEKAPADLKVPSRFKIAPRGAIEKRKVSDFCEELVAQKEKLAQAELEAVKQNILAEVKKKEEARLERERRWRKYQKYWGGKLGAKKEAAQSAPVKKKRDPVHVRLNILVPEISVYEEAAEASRSRAALAERLADRFADLDRDNDSKLTGKEYQDAAAIIRGTSRLLAPLDPNQDRYLTLEEIKAGRVLSEDIDAAIRENTAAVRKKTHRIRRFDANRDGVLDVGERKALTMAYASAALRYRKDAAFYRVLVENLKSRRLAVSVKYANLVIQP